MNDPSPGKALDPGLGPGSGFDMFRPPGRIDCRSSNLKPNQRYLKFKVLKKWWWWVLFFELSIG